MTTRVLVPLDGSPLSEQVLPAVKQFATTLGSCSIELFYVVDPATIVDLAPGSVVPPGYLKRAEQWASEYLDEQAKSLAGPGIETRTVVSIGPPARVILDHLKAGGFDYVYMATHGRSGLARAVIGSVTDRVIRESSVPVIAMHPRPAAAAQDAWPGDDAASPDLIRLFARGDLLSAQAVEVLTGRGTAAVPDLIKALRSHPSEVRQFAARTLGAIRDQAALPALVARLLDDVWEVRWEAEEAIVRFGEPGVRAVLQAATRAQPDERHNLALLHVLERAPLELVEILKPVIQALHSPEHAVTAPIAAAKALQRLANRPQAVAVA